MARGTLTIVLLWLAFSAGAYGQASDTELSAAYCLGYEQDVRDFLAQNYQQEATANTALRNNLNAPDPKVRADAQAELPRSDAFLQGMSKILSDTDHKIERLKAYLISKGFLSTNGDPMPFLVATTRGQKDYQDCTSQARAAAESCMPRCVQACRGGVDTDQCQNCLNSCPVPESCQRGLNCENLYPKLPF